MAGALARFGAKIFGPLLRVGSRVAAPVAKIGSRVARSGVGKAVGKVAGNKIVRFAAPLALGEAASYGIKQATKDKG